ncbi:unnamed protein product [Adineta steineri]|uniref:NHL repeat containing protein-like protein n=1 Tax=Adineta steineri TaxID=433720 RepID=A0A813Q7Q2_9BILA|nr:unnamed protein product [Adineta steineri]CAF3573038.1 unnamed protein product [Adineta steineri]
MSLSVLFNIRTSLWMLMFMSPHSIIGLWYNRPIFSSCATWNPNASTFTNQDTLGYYINGIFVDNKDTVYAESWYNNVIKVWPNASSIATRTITGVSNPCNLVVSMNGDIYVDNSNGDGQVDKWTLNSTSGVGMMNISKSCNSLFIDTNNTLYCSQSDLNRVIKLNLNDNSSTPVTIAGNGSIGSAANLLSRPWGIFVDTDFTLYVADCNNNRIQRFKSGEMNGTTVAGSTAPGTISLSYPGSVAVTGDGYLFIMDSGNYRIIRSSAGGFQCVAGCSMLSGSTPDKLNNARQIAFDSSGNIFVTDDDNHRVQKFTLKSNSCGKFQHVYFVLVEESQHMCIFFKLT